MPADAAASKKRPACAENDADCPVGDVYIGQHRDGADDLRRPVAGPPHPDWSRHYINVLRERFERLIEKVGTDATVTLWSDCAGKCTEASAWKVPMQTMQVELGANIRLKLISACDNTLHCKKFILANWQPAHFTDNIFPSRL